MRHDAVVASFESAGQPARCRRQRPAAANRELSPSALPGTIADLVPWMPLVSDVLDVSVSRHAYETATAVIPPRTPERVVEALLTDLLVPPTLLPIRDAHDDEASCDLLRHSGPTLRASPACLFEPAAQQDAVSSPPRARHRSCTVASSRPYPRADRSTALLPRSAADESRTRPAAAIIERACGNPLFVRISSPHTRQPRRCRDVP